MSHLMSTEAVLTILSVWLVGRGVLVAYLTGKAWLEHRRTRQAWRRTPILGPVRINVRRIL